MDENEFIYAIADSKDESIQQVLRSVADCHNKHRAINRPCISLPKILLGFFGWIAICLLSAMAILTIGRYIKIHTAILHVVCYLWIAVIFCVKAKNIVQNAILIYQKYAPEQMRRACLFTPSCSEYMLIAIDKYGIVVGVLKGLKRLSRCHFPNGGVDLP